MAALFQACLAIADSFASFSFFIEVKNAGRRLPQADSHGAYPGKAITQPMG